MTERRTMLFAVAILAIIGTVEGTANASELEHKLDVSKCTAAELQAGVSELQDFESIAEFCEALPPLRMLFAEDGTPGKACAEFMAAAETAAARLVAVRGKVDCARLLQEVGVVNDAFRNGLP